MVEEGLLQPQPDVIALGGVLLNGGCLPLGQGPGFSSGGAGIKQQPVDGEADRPIPTVGRAIGKCRAAATTAAADRVVGLEGR